jgi:hypothetical protein
MLRGFSFEFTDGVTPVSCDPVFGSAPTLQIETARDDDFGYYERSLKTALTFRGADYTYLKALEDAAECDEITLNIYHNAVLFFSKTLRIGTSHFAWDLDTCRVTVQGDDVNAYACFLAAWDTEINILTGTAKTVVNTILGEFETITCDDTPGGSIDPEDYPTPITDCITPGEGWTLIDQLVNTGGGNDSVFSTYIRQVYVSTCSGGVPVPPCGGGWILIDDNCPTDATYARPVPVTPLLVATELSSGELYRATAGVRGGADFDGSLYNNIPMSNGVSLEEILDTYLPCGLSVVSDFFSINGDATAPANDVYTAAAANLAHLFVFQKSDVKRANALNDATNGKWTIESLFGALKAQFDIEFRINTAGDEIRIEHTSYFAAANGEDLTSTQPSRLTGTNRYTYASDKQISEEKWRFAETASDDFEGVPYLYTCFSKTDRQKKEYVVNESNNDVGALIASPDSYADAGFVFVAACLVGSDYFIASEVSLLTGDVLLNGHLSIPNLMRTYHTYNRPRLTGTWNSSPVTFDSQELVIVQDAVSFKVCAEDFAAYDESLLVRTGLGWMRIESGTYDASSGTFTGSPRG